jgi:hypothetical protein
MKLKREKKFRKSQLKKDAIRKFNFFKWNMKISKSRLKLNNITKILMLLRSIKILISHKMRSIILSK